MTNFYAVYLFTIIAIILLGLGLWFKRGWVMIMSSIGWLVTSVYCFNTATVAMPYVYYFAVFCLAASIGTIIASMTANRKQAAQPPPVVSHSDYLAGEVDRVRKLRGKHSMKTKGYFEP